MLRTLAAQGLRSLARADASGFTRAMGTAPSVYDKIIDVTVIDKSGRRHAIRGVAGQNLAELLAAQVEAGTLEEDTVVTSPEGSGAVEAHVKVPNELLEAVPAPQGDDARWLSEVAAVDSVDLHSRLASRIVLDKFMNGSLVALGEHYPWRTL